MTYAHRSLTIITCLGLALTAGAPAGWALGFRNPDQGARATGQGEAFVARADDATAVYYNPAGLVQLDGTHLTSGGYLLFPTSEFSAGGGVNDEMNSASYLPHLYAASDFGMERFRFGLGVNVPFGNNADYGDGGPMRYTATDSMLAVMNFAPTVAVAITDQFSLGASVNIYYGDTELNRMAPVGVLLGNPLIPDGRFHFHGQGAAVGATVGAQYRFNEHHSVGAVYRSPFTIDFEGNAVIRNDVTGLFPSSSATAEIVFPQSVAFGYAFRPNDKWRFEVDADWTNWDMLNNVRLHSNNPFFNAATNPTSTIPFNWMDSWFYEFGAEYQLTDTWAIRTGYVFSENSVPDKSFNGSIPDSDRHVFSIGVGCVTPRFQGDMAYQFSILESRDVTGSPDLNFDGTGDADGHWRGSGHAIMFTGTLKF